MGDQSKVYLEGSLSRRWNSVGCQPLVADGARRKQAENIYGAVPLGTGHETATLIIDWQDSQATIAWLELILTEHPRGQIRVGIVIGEKTTFLTKRNGFDFLREW